MNISKCEISRRKLLQNLGLGSALMMVRNPLFSQTLIPQDNYYQFKYVFAAGLLGSQFPIENIPKYSEDLGFSGLDIWKNITPPQVSAFTAYGMAKYDQLLQQHNQTRKVYSWYSTAPENLGPAIDEVKALGGEMIVTGSYATHGVPTNADLTSFVKSYFERVAPIIQKAEDNGIKIAIENYSPGWMRTPEAVKEFLNQCPSDNYGLCFAPWHLPQDGDVLADIIKNADNTKIKIFYAWQKIDTWGAPFGSVNEGIQEYRKQLPAYGPLDFDPIIRALVDVDYQGLMEIFAHTYQHNSIGLGDSDTLATITKSRDYLEDLLQVYNYEKFGESVLLNFTKGMFYINNVMFPLNNPSTDFQIYNSSGQLIYKGQVSQNNKLELGIPRGHYAVQYLNENKFQNRFFQITRER